MGDEQFFDSKHTMELRQTDRGPATRVSLTPGDLLKRVEDIAEGDSQHQVVEMHDVVPQPRPLTFLLAFTNLTYSVKVRHKMTFPALFTTRNELELPEIGNTKTLLNDISGEAREGEIMAVLGASGSGKSTLIDALANRIARSSLKGSVALNGEPLESKLLKVISAYVMQDDLLFPMLTVEETLMFSAEFRLPRSLSKSKKKARVQALIDQLGLRKAAKTVIGTKITVESLAENAGEFPSESISFTIRSSCFWMSQRQDSTRLAHIWWLRCCRELLRVEASS